MSGPAVIHRSGWPWPLDAVQGWFESLWSGIQSWINNAVSVITDFVTNAIKVVQSWIGVVETWIGSAVTSICNFVTGAIAGVATWISDAAASTVGFLTSQISAAAKWILEGVEWVVTSIKGGLDAVVASLTGIVADIGRAVADFGKWIGESVQGSLGWLSNTIWGWIDGSLKWASDTFAWLHSEVVGAIAGVAGTVKNVVDNAMAGIGAAFGGALSGFITWLLDGVEWVTNKLVGGIIWIGERVQDTFKAVSSFLIGPLTKALMPGSPPKDIEGVAYAYVDTLQKRIMAELEKVKGSPAEPELAIAAGFGILAAMTTASVVGQTLGMAYDATHPVKEWGAREMITHIEYNLLHSAFGSPIMRLPIAVGILKPMEYAYNRMFTPMVPPIADLIRFVVKEVITPERFTEIMPFHGYAKEWADAYWEEHFRLPAPAVLYDAFHRGRISSEELNKYIFWHDYKPEPRPEISVSDIEIMRSVLKTLIPRVDLRYAWEMGRISDEELVERYTVLGYEEDAELMADIQKLRAMTEEIHKVRDEWIRDFLAGYIEEDVLRANLAAINIGPTRIDYYVAYAKKRREREHKKRILDLYDDGYYKDLITEDDLKERAAEILVDPDALKLFLEAAYIRKMRRPRAS